MVAAATSSADSVGALANRPVGVLANDADAGLTATLLTGPAHGTPELAEDGTFTYTPDAGWTGLDTYDYSATDGVDDHGLHRTRPRDRQLFGLGQRFGFNQRFRIGDCHGIGKWIEFNEGQRIIKRRKFGTDASSGPGLGRPTSAPLPSLSNSVNGCEPVPPSQYRSALRSIWQDHQLALDDLGTSRTAW
jgi:hypothetical protein